MFISTFFRWPAAATAAAALLVTSVGISTAPVALVQDTATQPVGWDRNRQDSHSFVVVFDSDIKMEQAERMQIISKLTNVFGVDAYYGGEIATEAYIVFFSEPVPF